MNTSSTQSAQRSDYVHTHLTEVLFNRHVTSLAAYDDFPPSMQWDADKRQASRGWHLNPKPSWIRAFSLTAAAKRHSSCAAYLSSQQGGEPTTYIVVRAREKRSPAQSRSGRRQRRGISSFQPPSISNAKARRYRQRVLLSPCTTTTMSTGLNKDRSTVDELAPDKHIHVTCRSRKAIMTPMRLLKTR